MKRVLRLSPTRDGNNVVKIDSSKRGLRASNLDRCAEATEDRQFIGRDGISPFGIGDLVKQLDGKWTVQQASGFNGDKVASVGYRSVEFNMFGLEAQLIVDRMCPVNRLYGVDLDDWLYFHAGAAPQFLLQKQTGQILKPSETSDAWECRIGEYGNYVTSAPHKNVVGIRS